MHLIQNDSWHACIISYHLSMLVLFTPVYVPSQVKWVEVWRSQWQLHSLHVSLWHLPSAADLPGFQRCDLLTVDLQHTMTTNYFYILGLTVCCIHFSSYKYGFLSSFFQEKFLIKNWTRKFHILHFIITSMVRKPEILNNLPVFCC